ncbi:MAG: ABC transporter substrate-binding protein [Bacteroidaceae bacterium]|nr:ABC transporter substrate-binding protein [Bacteroidaceae bacterium]
MKKKITMLLMCFLSFGLLFGCMTKKEPKADTFKYVGLKVYDPVYVAKDKGFFDAVGLNVEIVDTVAGGATAVQMVSSGDVQGALLSTMALVNARSNGLPVLGVADIQSAFEAAPLEEFYVRKDSGIKTIEDLKGKKIAINLVKSSFHYTWLMALENAGMTADDVTFVSLSFDQQEAALMRGDVDAIGLMQPYAPKARVNPDLEMLYDATDIFGERQFCEIFVNSVWADNNEESTKKFVSGIVKAVKWIENNQEESKQIISKYTGIEAKYIDDYHFQENGMVVESDAKYWLEYMKRTEGAADYLTVDDVVSNKYNSEVK